MKNDYLHRGIQTLGCLYIILLSWIYPSKLWAQSTSIQKEVERTLASVNLALNGDSFEAFVWKKSPKVQALLAEVGITHADLVLSIQAENPSLGGELRTGDTLTQRPFEVNMAQDISSLLFLSSKRKPFHTAVKAKTLEIASKLFVFIQEAKALHIQAKTQNAIVSLLESQIEQTQVATNLIQKQREAGNISVLDEKRQEDLLDEEKMMLSRSLQEQSSAWNALKIHIGIEQLPSDISTHSYEIHLPSNPRKAELISLAKSKRLDLSALSLEKKSQSQIASSASLRWIPRIEFDFHAQREPEGVLTYGPGVQVELPIFNRNQSLATKARLREKQIEFEERELQNNLLSEIDVLLANLEQQQGMLSRLESRIIPRKQAMLEETLRFYNFMLKGVYDLLQLRKDLLNSQVERLRLKQDIFLTILKLEQCIGIRFSTQGGSS